MKGLANITSLLAIGLVIGALAGSVVLGAPTAVAGSVSFQGTGGSDPGSHGVCVSSYVHQVLSSLGVDQTLGQLVNVMARRC